MLVSLDVMSDNDYAGSSRVMIWVFCSGFPYAEVERGQEEELDF